MPTALPPSRRAETLARFERFGIRLGLERIRLLLDALGRPQDRFPSILVAGTNGKGSVSAMLERALRRNGLRTGLYTSPHLVRVEERVRVDGAEIPPRAFDRRLDEVVAAADRLEREGRLPEPPTYFEVLTALGLLHFAAARVEIAILEVGLGGRFDATNAVDPILSVVTTIARDHVQQLGRTLPSIAFEKAGILRPGVPVVSGVRSPSAERVIRRRARELGAPFIPVFGRGRRFEASRTPGGYRFAYGRPGRMVRLEPSLPGRHQGENAATAFAAAEVLSERWRPLHPASVRAGIRDAAWPGRLEIVSRRPLVILDGAHNDEGARALAAYLREVVRTPVVLVFAVMKDKDMRAMARDVFPLARRVIVTSVPNERCARPEDVAAAAGPFRGRVVAEPDLRAAWRRAVAESAGASPIVVAGSLFLVGEFKALRLRYH